MILVTGGTGLLGSHLLYDLLRQGREVRALKRPQSNIRLARSVFSCYGSDAGELFDRIEWVDGDVLDVWSLQEAMEGVRQVYHCAAIVSFNPATVTRMRQTNVTGTANMVNAALVAGAEKFCYVSSIAALGRASAGGEEVTELTEWQPSHDNSFYAVSKHEAEREVWRGIAEGMDAVILNPSIIIGPGDWRRGSASIFYKAWQGLKFYTSGVNGFVDVRDVAAAMIRLTDDGIVNERFIISSENCPYKLVFEWMAEAFGRSKASRRAGYVLSELAWRIENIRATLTGASPLITRETARMANTQYRYSNRKIRQTLGMDFIPVEKSVKDTAAIFREVFGGGSWPAVTR